MEQKMIQKHPSSNLREKRDLIRQECHFHRCPRFRQFPGKSDRERAIDDRPPGYQGGKDVLPQEKLPFDLRKRAILQAAEKGKIPEDLVKQLLGE